MKKYRKETIGVHRVEGLLKDIKFYLAKILKVNEEQQKNTISKGWQFFFSWTMLFIAVLTLLAAYGIYLVLSSSPSVEIPIYDISVAVSPDEIKLNEGGNIPFTFTFKNIGKENISDFDVYEINLYRLEKGKPTYLSQLYHYWNKNELYCSKSYSTGRQINFGVGDTCTIKTKIYGCGNCFDDKDKIPQIYVYFKSVPLLENKIVNLSIY